MLWPLALLSTHTGCKKFYGGRGMSVDMDRHNAMHKENGAKVAKYVPF